jgi:hypothetical protein
MESVLFVLTHHINLISNISDSFLAYGKQIN